MSTLPSRPILQLNPLLRLGIWALQLPTPAMIEDYSKGQGTLLPHNAYRRWNVWSTLVLLFLIFGIPSTTALVLQLAGTFDAIQPKNVSKEKFQAGILTVTIIIMLLTMLLMMVNYIMSTLNYAMLEYRFDDLGLHIRKGTFQLHEITLSYRNIQNVSIQRGPIDLLLGLSKVVVDTAGGGGGAAQAQMAAAQGGFAAALAAAANQHRGQMVGLDRMVAEDLRRDLVARMQAFQDAGLGEERMQAEETSEPDSPTPVVGNGVGFNAEQLELLKQTLANLRAANQSIHLDFDRTRA